MPRLWFVDGAHPRAKDRGLGTRARPFRTINAAAQVARPGDTVRIGAGIYRERVAPAIGGAAGAPVTYEAVVPGSVIIKGSDAWRPQWRPVRGRRGVYRATLPAGLRRRGAFNPFATPMPSRLGARTLGEIFLRGAPLGEVDSPADLDRAAGVWCAAADGRSVYYRPVHPTIDLQPTAAWEITARGYVFAPRHRGLGHIVVRDLVIEHCANPFPQDFWQAKDSWPQAGAISTRSGHGWLIERCTVRLVKGLGLDCGTEGGRDPEGQEPKPETYGGHTVRDCNFLDCGVGGIAGWQAKDCRVTGNVVRGTNRLGFFAPEAAGIKLHQCFNTVVEGNLLLGNDAFGIWLDNGYAGARVTRNVCLVNRGAGIFIEMGRGACLVDHNICALTTRGEGIYTHDASDVTIAHNLLFQNANHGVYCRKVTERRCMDDLEPAREEVGCSRLRILNNLFIDNYRTQLALPPDSPHCRDNVSDHNLFISGAGWQWEGPPGDRFVLTTNDGRVALEMIDALLEKAGVDAAEWRRHRLLTFEQWRAATGWDRHSQAVTVQVGTIEVGAVAKGACGIAPLDTNLHFRSAEFIAKMKCPRVLGPERDFHGHALAGRECSPGPFQALGPECQILPLWRIPQ
jgi:hypothetical protein